MASVYKRTRKDGTKSDKYYITYKNEYGKFKTEAGYTDERATWRKARELETNAAMVRDGLISVAESKRIKANRVALAAHLGRYREFLLAKPDTERHVAHTIRVIETILAIADIKRIGDIEASAIQTAIGVFRRGDTTRNIIKHSPRTCNHALNAVKAFVIWADDDNLVEGNPLRKLKPMNESVDRVRERRAITPDEFSRLLEATRKSEPIKISRRGAEYEERWLTGEERAMLYRLAYETGFRANELRSLTRASFELDADPPCVVLEAKVEKKRRGARQPLRAEFVAVLKDWLPGRPTSGPLIRVPDKTAKLLLRDLNAAGIPYRDEKGQYADFHAIRGTLVTDLLESGSPIHVTQSLARHAHPSTTLKLYAKVDDGKRSNALEKLPSRANSDFSANAVNVTPHDAPACPEKEGTNEDKNGKRRA